MNPGLGTAIKSLVALQVAPVAGWICWLPSRSAPLSLTLAEKPATVGEGKPPGRHPPSRKLMDLKKAQLSALRLARKVFTSPMSGEVPSWFGSVFLAIG